MAVGMPPLLVESVTFLGAAVIAVPIAKRFGLGSIIGFLAAGIAVGPSGLGLFTDGERVLEFAETGVVLLLFVIGLELQPSRLWRMKRDIFGLGTAQVFLCALLIGAAAFQAGYGGRAAVVVGFGLALSSTAFAVQLMQERGQLNSPYGQRAFAILLLQDLAIVPLLALVTFLAPEGGLPEGALTPVNKIMIILAAVAFVIIAGRYLLTPFFRLLTRADSREIMTAAALLVVLGSAALMQAAGLSMAMGAFLAGVMLAESSFRHQLEADIEPFRGILLGLFFMAVGMTVNLGQIVDRWAVVIIGVVALMTVKGAVIWALCRLFGASNPDALRVAVTLPQGGEFGFVLFATAVGVGLMAAADASLLIAVITLSMAATPIVCLLFEKLASRLRSGGMAAEIVESFEEANPKVLIIGFGRFGLVASQMLTSEGLEVTALDRSPSRIRVAEKLGYRVYYGDATRVDVLRKAGAGDAQLIAMCIEDDFVAKKAIPIIQREFPDAALFCRASDQSEMLELTKINVDFVAREVFESGIVFGKAALQHLGISPERILAVEEDVRARDEERLQLQLELGDYYAGREMLHRKTPRPGG